MTMKLLVFLAVVCTDASVVVKLDPYTDDSIRIRVAPTSNGITEPPLQALCNCTPNAQTLAVSGDGVSELTNGNLKVSVDVNGLLTAIRVSDGKVLLKQTAMTFAQPNVPVTRAGSVSAMVSFAGTANEKVYGLGEHRTGVVNQMPYHKRFADSQDYGQSHGSDVSMPWYASSLGYGFVWNSPAYGYTDISETEITWFANATLGADMWITTTSAGFDATSGKSSYAELLKHYVDAVGHASTMPYYSTGFIQCKDRYRNQTQVLDVARGYIERQLPISVIVIDWMHWVAQGDWHFNPACWPDPQGMVDELRTMGIETMVTFWPFQSTGSRYWDEFTTNGYLVNKVNKTNAEPTSYDGGNQYLVDETNPKVREVVFDKFWEGYGQYGIKTVWIDAAEPEHSGAKDEGTWKMSLGTDAEVGEAWIQQHARTFADGFATKGIAASDYFILPRHAWIGSWRYSAALWSGDIVSTFDELAIQVKVLQGVMMSGVSLWTTDIGGYNGGDPTDPTFQELIVRWFQFGAFCPLFRLHGHRQGPHDEPNQCGGTNGPNEVWNLAKDAVHYNAITNMMRLREELREYVSQINLVAAQTGMPMIRPMFLQFPNDGSCQGADVEDQYMFGPDWLVGPVTEMGAKTRSIYLPGLPANQTWVYYFNYSEVGGVGGRFEMDTPIGEFPLFFIRPVMPAPPVKSHMATQFYSKERNDLVLCCTDRCDSENSPTEPGSYALQSVIGTVVADATDATVPLYLHFSNKWNDNFISTNSTGPDASYVSGVNENDGFVFAAAPKGGGLALQTWYKKYSDASQDYATVVEGPSLAWVQGNGYTNVTTSVPVKAWLMPKQ